MKSKRKMSPLSCFVRQMLFLMVVFVLQVFSHLKDPWVESHLRIRIQTQPPKTPGTSAVIRALSKSPGCPGSKILTERPLELLAFSYLFKKIKPALTTEISWRPRTSIRDYGNFDKDYEKSFFLADHRHDAVLPSVFQQWGKKIHGSFTSVLTSCSLLFTDKLLSSLYIYW